jgi:hypothetical protein
MRACIVGLVVLSALGCKKEKADAPTEASNAAPVREAPKLPTLADYCRGPCRTFDAAAAAVRTRADAGGYCLDATIESCDGVRSVEFSDGFSRFAEFFDETGTMIGARTWSDMAPAGAVHGKAPTCKPATTTNLCPH